MSFDDDFKWQMQHLSKVNKILGDLPGRLFTQVRVAPREADIKRNTDMMILPYGGKDVALRLRRPHKGYFNAFGLQFTIRSKRNTGAETELSKLQRGLGDWFFYGHIEETWER